MLERMSWSLSLDAMAGINPPQALSTTHLGLSNKLKTVFKEENSFNSIT
jgi:hypothetical protein